MRDITLKNKLAPWKPEIKFYPHFDSLISASEASDLATNSEKVNSHKFFPFLSYTKSSRKFGSKKVKERPISYAARRDSCIYSYYRHLLLEKYNQILDQKGLGDCVIAYRQIIDPITDQGKSNINFAKEAFEEIKKRKNCIAIALDISKFFQTISHVKIKEKWKMLLDVEELSEGHFTVFKNITNYKIVDLDECYLKLGLMERVFHNGKIQRKFRYERKKQPKQLCTAEIYRKKIVGIIKENPKIELGEKCGIPQGSPISDIIANMYMLDFDEEVKTLMNKIGGYYRRYSDDILIICPPDRELSQKIIREISTSLRNRENLKINSKKTISTEFSELDGQIFCQTFDGKNLPKNNAFEYLGHAFDGDITLLKNQTLTNYYKKMHRAVKAAVHKANEKFCKNGKKGKIEDYLDRHNLFHRFSVTSPDLTDKDGKPCRNFMTYVNRSSHLSGNDVSNESIANQIKNHKKILNKAIREEISYYNKIN